MKKQLISIALLFAAFLSPTLLAQTKTAPQQPIATNTASQTIPPATRQPEVTTREVFDAAKTLYEASKQNIEHTERMLKNIGYVALFIFGVLAFFIGKNFRSVMVPFKKKLAEEERTRTANLATQLATVDKEIKEHKAKFEKIIRGDMDAAARICLGMTMIDLGETINPSANEHYLSAGIEHFDKALEVAAEDFSMRGLALAYKAYAIKRQGNFESALDTIKLAISQSEKAGRISATYLFNAACYASLSQKKTIALAYLSQSIQADASNLNEAIENKDTDLQFICNSTEFKNLVKTPDLQ